MGLKHTIMKIYKLLQYVVLLVVLCSTNSIFAQFQEEGNATFAVPIVLHSGSIRDQFLNQYTDVFISSPNNGTVIQSVHEDSNQETYFHSDKFFFYDQAIPNYVQLPSDLPDATIMTPGVGYVLQTGGNGIRTESHRFSRKFNFSGGGSNDGVPHTVQVNSGSFCLLGNPYSGFLNLDTFLMNPSNKTKVRGPILLWSHNTVIAPDPSNSGMFIFTSNDYAMYNVLGGVAAGRSIGPSSEKIILVLQEFKPQMVLYVWEQVLVFEQLLLVWQLLLQI